MAEAKLRARMDLDKSGFDVNLAKARQSVVAFGSGQLQSIGRNIASAFAVGAIEHFAKETLHAGHEIEEFANIIGGKVEQVQSLRVAAEQSGASADAMSAALMRIKKASNEAANGNAKVIDAFDRLGFSTQQIISLSPESKFELISKAIKENGDSMEMQQAAGVLLGRGYVALTATMQRVADDGLAPMTAKMREANQIMSEESVRAAAEMGRAYESAGRTITTTLRNVVIEFAGGLMAAFGAMGGGWDAAAEELFGKPKSILKTPAEMAAEKRTAQEINAARSSDAYKQEFELWQEYAAFQFAKAKIENGITVGRPEAADQFARIGGYTGGQMRFGGAEERREKLAEKIAELMEKHADSLSEIAGNTKDTADTLEEMNNE